MVALPTNSTAPPTLTSSNSRALPTATTNLGPKWVTTINHKDLSRQARAHTRLKGHTVRHSRATSLRMAAVTAAVVVAVPAVVSALVYWPVSHAAAVSTASSRRI